MKNEKNANEFPKPLYNVYSVFDKATESFGVPFFDVNDRCAIRRTRAVYQGNPVVDDLVLYHIGLFDTGTGNFDPVVYDGDHKKNYVVCEIADLYEVKCE